MHCVTQDDEKAGRTQSTHRDSDQSNWFVSMLHVLQTIVHALLERRRWRRPLLKAHYDLCACVCCVVHTECTYVHVHVCGSARSGGGAHLKWTCHMEAHDNWK